MYMEPIRAATSVTPPKRRAASHLILGLVALPFIIAGFIARLSWHFMIKDLRAVARVSRAIGEEIGNVRR